MGQPATVPPLPYRTKPPQVLLAVGAVLLVSAGATLASAHGGPVVRGLVLALAAVAAGVSVRAHRAGLRSSAETFAASAAGLGLGGSDLVGSPATGDALVPLCLAGVYLGLHVFSRSTAIRSKATWWPAAWPLAAWAAGQVAVLRSLDLVPGFLRTELFLGVAVVGLGTALWGRPLVGRLTMATTAPWFAAGVLGGSVEAWTGSGAGRWLATALVAAAAGGLLLARLRRPLDVLLGPPRLVPVVAGAGTAAAVTGACSAGGPVAVAVAGFAGVLVAAAAAAELSGWRRGLLLPVALTGGVLLAVLSIARLVDGRHWSEIALLLLLTAVPTVWVAVLRRDDRPVAAPTALGCLAGAALLGLPDGWASPSAVAVLLTGLYVLALATTARLDRDSRRATAVAGAAVAAIAVGVLVTQGAAGPIAVHLAVQGAVTLAWAWWTGGPGTAADAAEDATTAWRVGAVQLVLAGWIAAADAGLGAVEAYSLPAAAGLLLASGRGLLRKASWPTWGPALVVAAAPSTVLAIASAELLRVVLVLGAAAVAMVAGGRAGLRAPLLVGAVTALALALGLAARSLPWPGAAVLIAGSILLVIGMLREHRPVAGFAARLADLR
ncbi:SCO7613 C-terminal domain-containing membrane protein [Blastococcus sp. LR1]|uniref:SCO7613 C-terminal domain-containing membrane protein n=1 Tax=Blastococcus sp. LR1 TaxID=2877000 RepID=UPI001CCFC57C|nr:hypothetical protein [Blastococcus sp. LR1]MCA0145045.1 hypothetical protein [Blastococcus sp. LR1]